MVKEESTKPDETSMFDSSEMLASVVASTPLMEEAWKLCRLAGSAAPGSFAVNQVEDVTYLAFSGVNPVAEESSGGVLVPLDSDGVGGIFSALLRRADGRGEVPPMVYAGFLTYFLAVYNTTGFQNQMQDIMTKSKAIVFTGHSVGGATASLSTLWLLSRFAKTSSRPAVMCITFGSPMLGNESFSKAILEERWGGNFCHLVAQDDIMPALLFAPLASLAQELRYLLEFWHKSMMMSYVPQLATPFSDEHAMKVHRVVLATLEALAGGKEPQGSPFWPFGSYLFCTIEGAICLDPAMAVLKLLYVILSKGSPQSSVENHLCYEKYLGVMHWQFLKRRCFAGNILAESNNDAGVAFALQSSGLDVDDSISGPAKDSLEMTKQSRKRNLNSAKLTVELCHVKTLRVQIEWYKAFCDQSDSEKGYYDSFKERSASRRESKVYKNCVKLAKFWDNIIKMVETNQLPHDFHKQSRWVNASQFCKLLIEPLEIAEYYRNNLHHEKGHYLENGREKRYKIFDKWWNERDIDSTKSTRNEFASLTQDTCFWARVEEARDWLEQVRTENDPIKQCLLLDKIKKFEQYAKKLIDIKEVSKDVLFRNSSYTRFSREWTEIKSQLQLFGPQFSVLL